MSSPPTDDLRLRFRGAVRHRAGPQQLAQAGFRSRGLPTPQLHLLSALRFGGPRRLRDPSGELGVIARNVTGLVDALQGDGLVERLPQPSDRRPTLVRLTPGRGAPGG